MISVLLAAVVGFLAARMLWLAMRKSWSSPSLMRNNFHGASLPTAAGIVLSFALIFVEGLRAVFGGLGLGEDGGLSPIRAAALVIVLGFSILGLIDDLIGGDHARGLSGHFKALASGELTSGGIKFIGGILIALTGASFLGSGGFFELIVDAAVIALAANMANLFDLRPGRAIKVSVLAFVAMALFSGLSSDLLPVALVIGAAIALFLDDMHERLMLGDTGANAMGAALGLGLVALTGQSGSLIALGVLMALTILSEFVSFSKIFDSVGPLRAFDRFGRKPSNQAQPTPAPESGAAPFQSRTQETPPQSTSIDVRDGARLDDDVNPDQDDSTDPSMRATVGSAHVGATASSSAAREQSPFSSSSSRERSATRPVTHDEFDDTPDFFAPSRPSAGNAEPLPGMGPRSGAPERRSPFDDDEDF